METRIATSAMSGSTLSVDKRHSCLLRYKGSPVGKRIPKGYRTSIGKKSEKCRPISKKLGGRLSSRIACGGPKYLYCITEILEANLLSPLIAVLFQFTHNYILGPVFLVPLVLYLSPHLHTIVRTMTSLRRQPARTHRTTANRGGPDTQTAFVAPPARFQEHGHTGPTHAFSTTNLTVISGAGTDSTFSTMATQTDLPGTGRVIDKYVFQPAGRKLEAFIGGIVRSISMRKTARQRRRDSSAARTSSLIYCVFFPIYLLFAVCYKRAWILTPITLYFLYLVLAGELAEPGATEEVAPPYSTQRTSRPLPQVPEHTNVHSTIMPWLAQTGAYYAQSIQSYPASERVYSPSVFLFPRSVLPLIVIQPLSGRHAELSITSAPTTTYTPYPFMPQPYRNTESVRPIYNAPTAPASTAGDDPSPNLDTSWWGGGAVASVLFFIFIFPLSLF